MLWGKIPLTAHKKSNQKEKENERDKKMKRNYGFLVVALLLGLAVAFGAVKAAQAQQDATEFNQQRVLVCSYRWNTYPSTVSEVRIYDVAEPDTYIVEVETEITRTVPVTFGIGIEISGTQYGVLPYTATVISASPDGWGQELTNFFGYPDREVVAAQWLSATSGTYTATLIGHYDETPGLRNVFVYNTVYMAQCPPWPQNPVGSAMVDYSTTRSLNEPLELGEVVDFTIVITNYETVELDTGLGFFDVVTATALFTDEGDGSYYWGIFPTGIHTIELQMEFVYDWPVCGLVSPGDVATIAGGAGVADQDGILFPPTPCVNKIFLPVITKW